MAEKILKDLACKNAKPEAKPYRLKDGAGLFLLVRPDGGKYWQYRFVLNGKEKLFQYGPYPEITLEAVRLSHIEQRRLVREGKDPVTQRRVSVAKNIAETAHTFEVYSRDWLARMKREWSAAHLERNTGLLERILFPAIGKLPMLDIDRTMVTSAMRETEKRGIAESARRAGALAAQIVQAAVDDGALKTNPLIGVSKVVSKPETKHFAAIQVGQLGELLRKVNTGRGKPEVSAALLLLLYTGLRDHEVRGAKWKEIDTEAAIWNLPAERMKRREPHSVSLPTQAIELLNDLRKLTYTGPESYVFASNTKSGYLSESTLASRIQSMGFEATAHGMRSLLTDNLNELGFRHDWIERQLHHKDENKVSAAYKRTDFFEQRKGMMQYWADYCDRLKAGSEPSTAATNIPPFTATKTA